MVADSEIPEETATDAVLAFSPSRETSAVTVEETALLALVDWQETVSTETSPGQLPTLSLALAKMALLMSFTFGSLQARLVLYSILIRSISLSSRSPGQVIESAGQDMAARSGQVPSNEQVPNVEPSQPVGQHTPLPQIFGTFW